VLTKEQVALLQKGLSRDQVRGLLGSPLVTSAFHADRWDYVFTIERQGVPAQERRYSLTFKGDELDTFGGDSMPGENEFVATLVKQRTLGKVPPLKASEESLRSFASANAARNPAPAAATSSAPIRTDYPPLEAPAAPQR
jgi:outer membrane protein assembly factor BamE